MDFPGKILLFGEFGILLNSMALAIPFSRYSGRFRFAGTPGSLTPREETGSKEELGKLFSYLQSGKDKFSFLELDHLQDDLQTGLYFDSSIPYGSGLGSSGALTAALYSRYAKAPGLKAVAETREHLAAMESHFHGLSSGIDPLTSYVKKPVLLENLTSTCKTVDLSMFFESHTLFLINTHYKAKTSKLVGHFMENYQRPQYREKVDTEYIPLVSATIKALLSGDFQQFGFSLKSYSLFQLTHFGEMIPENLKKLWKQGLDREDFALKICGSGGGGYMLAISRNRSETASYFNSSHLDYSVVERNEIIL